MSRGLEFSAGMLLTAALILGVAICIDHFFESRRRSAWRKRKD